MHNSIGADQRVSAAPLDTHQLIVDDIRALIAHVDVSMRLVASGLAPQDAWEDGLNPASSLDVVVLDDVTPRYARVSEALIACKTGLHLALQSLVGPGGEPAGEASAGGF